MCVVLWLIGISLFLFIGSIAVDEFRIWAMRDPKKSAKFWHSFHVGTSVLTFLIAVVAAVVAFSQPEPFQMPAGLVNDSELAAVKNDFRAKIDQLSAKVPGAEMNVEKWRESYRTTPQFYKDCYTWQKKHPAAIARVPSRQSDDESTYCPDGQSDGVCIFTMRKKAPDGSIQDLTCVEQKDPNDFLP